MSSYLTSLSVMYLIARSQIALSVLNKGFQQNPQSIKVILCMVFQGSYEPAGVTKRV